MIYVLAYPEFEPSCAARIDAFRAQHEPERARLVRPHITLVFGSAEAHLGAITDLVDDVACAVTPLTVTFDATAIEFDPFEKTHKIFLLCGQGHEALTVLHECLYGGPHRAELDPKHPFRPHMTIGSFARREEIEAVDMSDVALPMQARITGLEVVRFAHGRLTPLKTVTFTD